MHLRFAALLLTFAFSSHSIAAPPSSQDVESALARATDFLTSISTHGGYLWRYSSDLDQRFGEEKATRTQIWVQPPGTPSVGTAFLRAFVATKDERHLKAAESAALALANGQLVSGGWAYLVEFDPAARKRWAYHIKQSNAAANPMRGRNITTFDDDNTQSALRFLMEYLDVATNRASATTQTIRAALDYGLAQMLVAQYPNGAWPQRFNGKLHEALKFPVRSAHYPENWPRKWPDSDYSGFYTLNDQTQRDCIRTMLAAYRRYGDRRHLDAARRGGEFLIRAQMPEPQPGWAQQYNFDMEPAWARAFEPPAVCSNESGGAMRTLVDLFLATGEEKFLEPIPRFLLWLKRSQLEPNKWARLYELKTNKPIYGDRDGEIHYTVAELSAERQTGYAWQGGFGVPEAISYYERVRSDGREKSLAQELRADAPVPSAAEVSRIIAAQDSQGRWMTNDWILMRTVAENITRLASYLGASRPSERAP